ncbi:hypothetical protein DFH11DRAFT_1510936 [Phellopilus nigrolimitatus]|nr:hypothetical protein DFH11DRAFT_1510936 [Phellopilus nigrolimitatus]
MSTIDLSGKGQSSRFNTRERELERRRAKGEASCAECKRLKLKCDRKGPCTSCVRRGCQSICPNGVAFVFYGTLNTADMFPGSLAAGQGTRFVLANTDKLHKKLLQMSKRIRQLEDALQIAQATISPASHPLLSDELLSVKNGVDVIVDNETPDSEEHDPTNDVSDAFGTLAISERGEVRFVGRGASEPATEQPSQDRPTEGAKMLPDQIVSASEAFPFTSAYIPREEILRLIEARLPTYARATALAEAYLGNIAWFCRIVRREQLMEELLPEVYKPLRTHNNLHDESSDSEEDYIVGIRSHLLPLLLAVLACGAAGDLTLPLNNDEAEVYVQLARAALSVHSVFWGASTVTVQTVVLLAAYDFCTCRKATPEPAWKMMTFGLSLAASVNRDPARWGLGQKIIQRRRFLFWELFHMDKWKASACLHISRRISFIFILESGRPATFNLREVDCEFPEDTDATIAEDGSPIPGFWRWKHRFAKEITAPIAEQLCLTRRIKYTEIIELDRKIRDFETHPDMLRPSTSFDVDDDFNVSLRRYMWGLFKEVSLLFIHRNFFARALLERPTSPMSSPFASSVLSAYASAITLLRVVREYFEKYPYLLLRQWIIWAHTLTSGVIIGSIAVRGQASTTAPTALKELNQVIDLFEKAKVHPVVRGGLVSGPCLVH